MYFRVAILLGFTAFSALSVGAQATRGTAPIVHTAADLLALEAKLTAAAKTVPVGVAVAPLDNFGTYSSLLIVRVRTGEAEQHDSWADQMIVQKGSLILVSGGSMVGEHVLADQPSERRGTSLTGGKELVLHAGDVVHIPAGLPHWVKLAPGASTTYLVFKEK
ncbi:MAG: cupin domain-containing protein [Acidobacteriota bacterium]|nr:cupin domain-containing protein [Acidobacteriota bacterium]